MHRITGLHAIISFVIESIKVCVRYFALKPGESHLPSPIRPATPCTFNCDIELSWKCLNTFIYSWEINPFLNNITKLHFSNKIYIHNIKCFTC